MTSSVCAQSSIQSPNCTGVIHGIVFDGSGDRVKGIAVEAWPMGILVGGVPSVETGSGGNYRFGHVCPGTYVVTVGDEKAGYPHASPMESAFLYGSTEQIKLTIENPQAELAVHLGSKPGFVQLHITNRETKADISKFTVTLSVKDQPGGLSYMFDVGVKNRKIEVPPDVICHVTADGFREWNESVGRGKLFRVQSGKKVTLEAELQPMKRR
jgi:hypothetical protein